MRKSLHAPSQSNQYASSKASTAHRSLSNRADNSKGYRQSIGLIPGCQANRKGLAVARKFVRAFVVVCVSLRAAHPCPCAWTLPRIPARAPAVLIYPEGLLPSCLPVLVLVRASERTNSLSIHSPFGTEGGRLYEWGEPTRIWEGVRAGEMNGWCVFAVFRGGRIEIRWVVKRGCNVDLLNVLV